MANQDFTPQHRQQPAGGFDAGSYRTAPDTQAAAPLTPVQQALARLEKALPAALRRRLVAVVLSVVVMLGAAVGAGGVKLRAQYNTARGWYTAGVAADNGYNLNEALTERENAAANILTTAGNSAGLGAESAEAQAARAALETFAACKAQVDVGRGSMAELYRANAALGAAVDQLYARMQELAPDPMKMGAVQGQYGLFNSAGTILGTLHYNEAVAGYQQQTGGFPANVLKGLFGIQEMEQFA